MIVVKFVEDRLSDTEIQQKEGEEGCTWKGEVDLEFVRREEHRSSKRNKRKSLKSLSSNRG